MQLEIERSNYSQTRVSERVNVLEIRDKMYVFTIDNIPEDKNTPPAKSVIDRLNADASCELLASDIKTAFRMGKFNPKAKYARQIRVTVSNDTARSTFLTCRGKLKANQDETIVWINELHPEDYRRRKGMLRDLVKHINNNTKYTASIEAGGLKLDNTIYMPDQFEDLPFDCQPSRVQSIITDDNGLAFSGQWICLSNLYACNFIHDGMLFHSAEQCYQYLKAIDHNKSGKAKQILLANNSFACMRTGESIGESKEWQEKRVDILYSVCKSKFTQNERLKEELLLTGERTLYEATKNEIWGVNASLKSKEVKECKGTGENEFGKLLERLRADLQPNLETPVS